MPKAKPGLPNFVRAMLQSIFWAPGDGCRVGVARVNDWRNWDFVQESELVFPDAVGMEFSGSLDGHTSIEREPSFTPSVPSHMYQGKKARSHRLVFTNAQLRLDAAGCHWVPLRILRFSYGGRPAPSKVGSAASTRSRKNFEPPAPVTVPLSKRQLRDMTINRFDYVRWGGCRIVMSRMRGKNEWLRMEQIEIAFVNVKRIKGKLKFLKKPVHMVSMDRLAIRGRGGRLRSIAAGLHYIKHSHEFKIRTDGGQFSIIADGFAVVPMSGYVP